MKKFLLLLSLIVVSLSGRSQNLLKTADPSAMEAWVDSVMRTLDTPEKRLGQLLMGAIYGDDYATTRAEVRKQIERYHLGGLMFFKETIMSQARLTNYAQTLAPENGLPPLLMAIDGEWGLAMRLTDAPRYPKNAALGQIHPEIRSELLYTYGSEVARQCRELGIHINFAPVLDVNSNPKNPVIGTRSYGAEAGLVAQCALSYAQGLEDGGVLSVAKHFPGHGDTDKDSHHTLPRLAHSRRLMLEREILPFQAYSDAGLGGVMAAFLDVPSLAEGKGMPAAASRQIITDLLRNEMGFRGLVITDGLAMKGASEYPDICVKALLAGVDILLQPHPIDKQWKALNKALKEGRLSQSLIDEKCRRVLRWKYCLVIAPKRIFVETEDLATRINTPEAQTLAAELTRLGNSPEETGYDPTLQLVRPLEAQEEEIAQENPLHQPFGDSPLAEAIDAVAQEGIRLGAFPGCQILVAQKGQILYNKTHGWLDADHKEKATPRSLYDLASMTKGLATVTAVMLCVDKYGLHLHDRLEKHLHSLKGTPIGRLTVSQCLMHETGLRDSYPFYRMAIDQTSIVDGLYRTKPQGIFTVRQDRNVWFNRNLKWNTALVSTRQNEEHLLHVGRDLWVAPSFRSDSLLNCIGSLKQTRVGQYRYSDLNFVLLRHVVEEVSGQRIDHLLENYLPTLFGANRDLCYNPLDNGIDTRRIAPTEDDKAIRRQQIRGFVHDETAAFAGGVEGNAGLFGNTASIYPVLDMLLNGGTLTTEAGKRVLKAETVKTFTTRKSKVSRRGLGFDKPDKENGKGGCLETAPASTYGHTGFTGTCFWVDPDNSLIYIFLSNRICPVRWNSKFSEGNYRTYIQEIIYDHIR